MATGTSRTIRADRADGFRLVNVTVEQGGYNNVDVVETNGFWLDHIVTRYAKNYGILSFASDHGLYEHIDAYGNGDSGVYPGSGPEGHCKRYGIEVRFVNSHDNVLGSSGTAGNGTWYHHNRFHHNNAGVALDSFAPGHPGMPQDCSKWTDNQIYSNNKNYFNDDRQSTATTCRSRSARRTYLPAVHCRRRLRVHVVRREPERDGEQPHLRQLALRHAAVLGAGHAARR